MRISRPGANQTIVHIGGDEFFFSYDTCVAGFSNDDGFWKVDYKYSTTTSKHVNKYLQGAEPTLVERVDVQLALDCL